MDYTRAIENLDKILTNEDEFAEINRNIFDAIDTDNSGTLEKEEVEMFMKDLLSGLYSNLEDFEDNFRMSGSIDENESGEITLDELGKYLRELFKRQVTEFNDIRDKERARAYTESIHQ
jgi:Ca2+-binding EF-hand superfamily protein